ncbi:DNA-binding regulatory protein, YebC/PmpR family [Dictyocaulus viviparus]|uniref:DNA-binding regulatory protein, YebC/PmpR family n=1 Tax=Dictyocaulus viviparus TaxID=29172 RepID=A0A0D8XYI1_DICVI|nr:DNA-binding regulatory protein, YebC/PmpR family [Dictyocaulus viviparus]
MLSLSISRRGIYVSSQFFKGHSKWQNIKETKGKNDALRSKAINLMLNKVRAAVIRGGFDPKVNQDLADLEQKFKSKNLPLEVLRNFLTKLKERPEYEVVFNVVGPSGTFFIVEAVTDNKKVLEYTMRKYFNKVGGFRFATSDSAVQSWFNRKGVVNVKTVSQQRPVSLEEARIEEIGIELDCEDVALVENDERMYQLICESQKLATVECALSDRGFSVESAEIEFRPTHPVRVEGEDLAKIGKFYEFLQEDDSIRQIYDNIEPET